MLSTCCPVATFETNEIVVVTLTLLSHYRVGVSAAKVARKTGKLSGELGLYIGVSKISTKVDQAADTFYVQDTEGRPFEDEPSLERLKTRIAAALSGTIKLTRELAGRESLPKRAHVFQVPPRVFIDNSASRFATVIEVNGRDRPGLLYDVTRALTECGLQITSAKVSTFGERVVDVFYVKDVFGMKVEHERKQADATVRKLPFFDPGRKRA